jgi:polysaccharide biosynthesis protein PslH
MNILFLTQILPYPPNAGPRIKTWHVLRYLVDCGHKVTLLTFLRSEERQYLTVLEEICHRVVAVPIQRSRKADIGYMLRSFVSGRPFLIERDDQAEMRQQVIQALGAGDIDVIHADQLTMAQFALSSLKSTGGAYNPRLIFDAHNATWTILDRMVQNVSWPLRPAVWLEKERVKKYEAMLVQRYDHTLAVTEIDRQALLQAVRAGPSVTAVEDKIRVIPIAVDAHNTPPAARKLGSMNILTLGTLHYPPNANGIRWFLNEVFPRVRQSNPGATLTVVGKNPPADFLRAAAGSNGAITVTG